MFVYLGPLCVDSAHLGDPELPGGHWLASPTPRAPAPPPPPMSGAVCVDLQPRPRCKMGGKAMGPSTSRNPGARVRNLTRPLPALLAAFLYVPQIIQGASCLGALTCYTPSARKAPPFRTHQLLIFQTRLSAASHQARLAPPHGGAPQRCLHSTCWAAPPSLTSAQRL